MPSRTPERARSSFSFWLIARTDLLRSSISC
ncbi:MAG: hypothetical protein HY276_07865 [Ignavibacteriales bacterium]|nr:hypothetical protein [Ignavibacteriales bacterium]